MSKIKLELNRHTVINILTLYHSRNDIRTFKEVAHSMLHLPDNWQESEWYQILEFVIRDCWSYVCDSNKVLELMESWCHKLHMKRIIGDSPSSERRWQIKLYALNVASLIFVTDEEKETINNQFKEMIIEYKIACITELLQEEKGEE